MATLLEYVGSVHIYLGPYRGNPIALYLRRTDTGCQIGPRAYPWNDVVGAGKLRTKPLRISKKNGKARGWLRICIQALHGKVGLSRNVPPRRSPPLLPSLRWHRLQPRLLQLLSEPRTQRRHLLRLPRNRLRKLPPLLRQSPRRHRLPQPKLRPNSSVSLNQFSHRSSYSVVPDSTATGRRASLLRCIPYVA